MQSEIYADWLSFGINRLGKFYKKSIDSDQITEILEAIYITCSIRNVFNDTVSSIIETSKYFPTIREIKNGYMAIKNTMISDGKIQLERLSNCLLCNGRGIVNVLKNNEEYAMSCKCIAGKDIRLPKRKFEPLVHDENMILSDKENEIYLKIRKAIMPERLVAELCPF